MARVTEKMNAEERLAKAFLESYGLTPARFTEEENQKWGGIPGRPVKLPDFKVAAPGGSFFYSEVKALQSKPEDQPLSFNMYGEHIASAVKQFEVVNLTHVVPNVLVWCSYERRNHFHNLELFYTGAATMSDGTVVGGFQKYSEGNIKEKKFVIDLHIWLDVERSDERLTHGEPSWFFSNAVKRPEHAEQLRRLFDVDSSAIKSVHPAR